ncbi:glycosyltransferase family 4 protein [Gordonia sp. VNK1]|uniref:glycosyltransferase family 4 protein n=1 Tax=Gordonia oleivorans TaxID=3156618 RepID=UPI0032B3C44F
MRILHLLNELRDIGNGIVNVGVDLAVEQARAGHQVAIASTGGEYVPLVEAHGVRHIDIDFAKRPRTLTAAHAALRTELAEHPVDIIHSHMLAPAALAYVMTRRGRTPRPGLVTTVHNEYQRGAILMALADRTVSVSNAVDDAFRRRHVPARRRRVVENGVIGTARRRRPTDVPAADIPALSIVSVAHVSHRKGADVLIDAFDKVHAEFPDAHLYFVGNADWTEVVTDAQTGPLAPHIHFVGLQREPSAYLKAAAVVTLPSRHDPFPLVMLEAREVGAPIVASHVDGIPEGLDGGAAGILVPVGDCDLLASEICAILRSDSHRADLARRSAANIGRFTVGRMADDYLQIYQELVEGIN